jgi:hypothetical protein
VEIPVDGRVRTVDGNSGGDGRCPQIPQKWLCSGICSGFVTFSLEWGDRSR